MSTKYVFVDIDGTLLSHHTGIPRSALEAIDIAEKKGVLNRALETTVPSEVYESLRREVNARKN